MTRSNEFPEFFTHFRAFQIYDLRPTRNKLFHLIGETKTMSIWRVKPLEHIIVIYIYIIYLCGPINKIK